LAIVDSFEELEIPPFLLAMRIHALAVVADLDERGRVVSTSDLSGGERTLPLARENLKKWTFVAGGPRRAVVVYYFKVQGGCLSKSTSHFQLTLNNFVTVTGCVNQRWMS
jgi:hypothetical protein